MPDNNSRVCLRLAFPQNSHDPERRAELRIEDATSGLMFAIIPMTGADLMDLLGNSLVGGIDGIPAWMLARPYRDALGLVQIPLVRRFPTLPEGAWSRRVTRENWEAKLQDWASQAANLLGGLSQSVTAHNNGTSTVTIRCYAPAEQAEARRKWLTAQFEKFPAPTLAESPELEPASDV